MGQVLLWIIGVYQDIIQVYNYGDVNHIGKDVVHGPLETRQGVGEPLVVLPRLRLQADLEPESSRCLVES